MLTTKARMHQIGLALIRARPILDSMPGEHPLRIEFTQLAYALPLEDGVISIRQAEEFADCVERINELALENEPCL